MIKFSIKDDEFKNYKETFSVGEFKATEAIEYFSTGETQAPPQEAINIQEDQSFARTQGRSENIRDTQNLNKNQTRSIESQSNSNSSSVTDGGSSTTTSSGANVTGGESTVSSVGSTAASATASATAATGVTTTAASIAGSVTVVAAAIVAIVVVVSNIINIAPTVVLDYFLVGTNYVSYILDISNLSDEVDYVVSVSNPNFEYMYDLRENLTEDGKIEGLVTGLTPHRSYKLQVMSVDSSLGYSSHYTYEFITLSDPKPDTVPKFTENIDYDNKRFNLDYNIFISDAYNTGSNTFVEFYINDDLFNIDTNLSSDSFFVGSLNDLPNSAIIKGVIKTTYEDEVIEIGNITYKVIYPREIITEDSAFMATYSMNPSIETSIGINEECYQYVYSINTEFNNSNQTTDMYLLELLDSNDIVLDSYKGTNSEISCAVNYDIENTFVYLTPISIINGEEIEFERRLLKTITNEPLLNTTSFVFSPSQEFIFTTSVSELLSEQELTCIYSTIDGSIIDKDIVDNTVEIIGNIERRSEIQFQIVDINGKIAGKRTIDLTQTSSGEIEFSAYGNFDLTEGFTIETQIFSAPAFANGEGYRLIVRDENNEYLGMGETTTDTNDNQSLTIPDFSHTFYRAALAQVKTIDGIEYIFENTANTDGCENIFVPFEEGSLVFDKEYNSLTFNIGVGSIFSEYNIDIISTITNTSLDGSTSTFNVEVPVGLEEANNSQNLSVAQWNNLRKTEVVITNSNKTIIYGKYTYNKADTLLSVSNYEAKNKLLVMNISVPDCPNNGTINYISFKVDDNNSATSGSQYYTAVADGDNWIIKVDELSSLTLSGSWTYSYLDNGLEISISDYVETSKTLDVEPVFDYALYNQYEGTDYTVYVRGYPAINGEEVPLSNWQLSIYTSDEFGATPITFDSGSSYIGPDSMFSPIGVESFICSGEYDYIVYKMTYGSLNTPLFDGYSSRYMLPTDEYDYHDLYDDAINIFMYEPNNFLTYNVSDSNNVESVNIYNSFDIHTTDTDIYYETYLVYNIDQLSGAPIYQSYMESITRDHPYMVFEDIPYNSIYNIYTQAYKDIEIGGATYKIMLAQINMWGTLVAGVRSDGHSATHGCITLPQYTGASDGLSIEVNVNLNHLASGESVEILIGNNSILIDPSVVADYVYNQIYDSEEIISDTLGTYSYTIINTKARETLELSAKIMLVIESSIETASLAKKVRIKNKVWSGSDYMLSEHNVIVKGISLASTMEPYDAIYYENGNPITGTLYTIGTDTVYAYNTIEDEIIITEFNIQ